MQITTDTLFICALAALMASVIHGWVLQAKLRKEQRINHKLLALTVALMRATKELKDIYNSRNEDKMELNMKPDNIEIIIKNNETRN